MSGETDGVAFVTARKEVYAFAKVRRVDVEILDEADRSDPLNQKLAVVAHVRFMSGEKRAWAAYVDRDEFKSKRDALGEAIGNLLGKLLDSTYADDVETRVE